jgi:Protein kinase domain/PASTA domain
VIGHRLGSRYELRRALGRGGTGQVYEAWDTKLGQRVAVKLLHERVGGDPGLVAGLTGSVKAAARVRHPNVVAIREVGHDGERHFMVMDLVEGRSVAELLRAGPLAPEWAAAIAADVCLALDQAHRRGVAHLDLEPANILVTGGGKVKVTGFGARQVGVAPDLAGWTASVGAAEYLAPEQAAGRYADGRADFYALGCCLYEMLTGRPPFGRVGEPNGDGTLSRLSLAARHLRDTPVPPHQFQPGMPAALDRVVLRALAKHPDARYQTAEEFRRDLDRFGRRSATAPPAPARESGADLGAGAPAWGAEASRDATAPVATRPAEVVLSRPAPVRAAAPSPAWAVRAPVATAGGASAAPASPQPVGDPPTPGAAPPDPRAPARGGRPAPATRRPARRVYLLVTSVAALLLAFGGTVAALSGFGTGDGGNQAAPPPRPSPESFVPPTTLAVASPTEPSTAETTTTTTAAPTTSVVATTSTAGQAATVAVPRVVGDDLGEAAAKLARQGLGTRVQAVPVKARPREGKVLDQEPPAGARVARGTIVTVTVGTRSELGTRSDRAGSG